MIDRARSQARGGRTPWYLAAAALVAGAAIAGCGSGSDADADTLTVYSGREEEIVAPLFEKFTAATGVKVNIRYGKSSEMAAQIAEEGSGSPADVFFSQDAGALGSVKGQLEPLPAASLERVAPGFRAADGTWVGTSGRVRVVVYNTNAVKDADLPMHVSGYATPKYASRLGIAPSNGSFQAFVSAMRITKGDAATKTFLADLKRNGVKTFEGNRAIVEAVADGDIDLGLVNHYYLALVKKERPDAPIANKFLEAGDPGALVNVAGVGVLASSKKKDAAQKFVAYLLSDDGQKFYSTEASENEYPLVASVPAQKGLPALSTLTGEAVPLGRLGDEEKATLEMITEAGLTS